MSGSVVLQSASSLARRARQFVGAVCLACTCHTGAAEILDDLSVNAQVLTLVFRCDVRLLGSRPLAAGLKEQIDVNLSPGCVSTSSSESIQRKWTDFGSKASAIEAVELHDDGLSKASLVITFSTPQVPTVRPGRGADTLLVAFATAPSGVVEVSATEKKIEAMMEEARQSFVRRDYDRAVALYTRLTDIGEHSQRANALEFLGVTRQHKGQVAHAKAIFDRYLKEYPDGDGRSRIEQRVAAMTAPPAASRRASVAPGDADTGNWTFYGSHSSYMRQNTVSIDERDDLTNLSMWQGDFDLITRRRGGELAIMSRVTAGYRADFAEVGRNRGGVVVTNAYVDVADRARGLQTRLGRLSRSSGGVYGRFDGGHLAWDWRDNVRLNIVGGFPVQRSTSTFESTRSMYGVSADIDAISDAWSFSVFANNHTVDGLADRRGVGGSFRYFEAGKNVYGLVDYDALYASLNATMLAASWTTDSRLNLHASFDRRRNPLLSTSNAIIGQGVRSIEELEGRFTEDELQVLAEDNTATSTSASIGFSWPVSDRLQWSADVQSSELETAASFSTLLGAQSSITTMSLSTQIVANNLWRQSDAWIVGLRYTDSDTYVTSSVIVNSRIPLTRHLRINPRLRLVYRENLANDTDEWVLAPGLRASLRWQRRFVVEAEIRHEVSDRSSLVGNIDRSSYYFSLGYRANFGR